MTIQMNAWNWGAAGLVGIVLVAVTWGAVVGRPQELRLGNGEQITFGPVAELSPQLSPDGQSVAFEYFPKDRPNLPQIWIMDRVEGFKSARPLVDNRNYNAEFSWSPDGKWLCFISNPISEHPLTSQIYKVRVSDSVVQQITHFSEGKTLGDSTSWSKEDLIAFENKGDIYTVNALDGQIQKLVEVQSRIPSLTPSEIRWSPDNSRLVFTGKDEWHGAERSRIWIADARTHESFSVTHSNWDSTPSWYDNNHVLFSRGQSEAETEVCLLTVDTGRVKCLTSGNVDLSPWADAATGELFLARGIGNSVSKGAPAFFYGFHIWRYSAKQ